MTRSQIRSAGYSVGARIISFACAQCLDLLKSSVCLPLDGTGIKVPEAVVTMTRKISASITPPTRLSSRQVIFFVQIYLISSSGF